VRTILLVDDEPNVLSGLTHQLRNMPYQVLTASSADDAVRQIETSEVDLVICDQEMPGMHGTQFLAWLAANHPKIIRILLTGHPRLETALEAINQGKIYHFFEKPCDPINLKATIRHAFEEKHMRETNRNLLDKIENVLRNGIEMVEAARYYLDAGNEGVGNPDAEGEGRESDQAPPVLRPIDDEGKFQTERGVSGASSLTYPQEVKEVL